MHPLAAGNDGDRGEAQIAQAVAHIEGGAPHIWPAQPFVRVEIENQPVRPLQPVDARAPDVEFDRAHLRGGDQRPRSRVA